MTGRATSSASEFFAGTRLLIRGFGFVARRPRLLLFGLIPAFISALIVFSVLATLVYFINDVAALVTWFADDWSPGYTDAVRWVARVTIVLGAGFISVLTFTALTMIVGDPFYEVISNRVDDLYGGEPEVPEAPWHRRIWRNLSDSVRTLVRTTLLGALLFVAGFTPVVGQVVVPVAEVTLGGWFLAVEISGIPFNRRGYRLAQRRQLLRANRAVALGFGVPLLLLFLIPGAAVLVMPGAVAGSTLMTRRVLGQPHH